MPNFTTFPALEKETKKFMIFQTMETWNSGLLKAWAIGRPNV